MRAAGLTGEMNFSGASFKSQMRQAGKSGARHCLIIGPDEAAAADVGIAGGQGEGLVFRKGEVLYKVPQEKLVDALMEEIDKL